MVKRWAILRRALQNSPDISPSTTTVRIARDTASPPPTCRAPLFFALRQLLKKYLALFLCKMSKSVPPATRIIMITTYTCMTVGGMSAESSAKGLLVNIKLPLWPYLGVSHSVHRSSWSDPEVWRATTVSPRFVPTPL